MKVKKELNTGQVERIKGSMSQVLTDRCPDRLVVFPSAPCTNIACKYAIQEPGYMNCTFVASEAGEHTLEAIGAMMGITREGVRLIEVRALKKLREAMAEHQSPEHDQSPRHQPRSPSGGDNIYPISKGDQRKNSRDVLPALDGRKLGECSR